MAADVTGVVTLGGVGVPIAAPFVAKIRHGAVDPSRVTVAGEGLDGAVRGGGVATIRILARDAFGNAIPAFAVGGRFRIAVEPRAPSLVTVTQPSPAYPRVSDVEGSGSGSSLTDRYAAVGGYVVADGAEFTSARVVVTSGDAVLADRNAKVVEPSGRSYSPAKSVAHGDGLAPVGVAGEKRRFFLTPRDEDGVALTSKDLYPPAAAFRMPVTKSGDSLESSSSSYKSFEAKVVRGSDPNDGSPFLEVTYSATEAGAYDVAVMGATGISPRARATGLFGLWWFDRTISSRCRQPGPRHDSPRTPDPSASSATLWRRRPCPSAASSTSSFERLTPTVTVKRTTTASRATSGPSPRRCDEGIC